jgi:hypothetical protein
VVVVLVLAVVVVVLPVLVVDGVVVEVLVRCYTAIILVGGSLLLINVNKTMVNELV